MLEPRMYFASLQIARNNRCTCKRVIAAQESRKKLFHVLVNQHALFFSKPAKYLTLKRSLDAARRLLLPSPFLFNYFNHRIYINVLETFSFEASFRAKIICKKRMPVIDFERA